MGNICNSGDICKNVNHDRAPLPAELEVLQQYREFRDDDDEVIIQTTIEQLDSLCSPRGLQTPTSDYYGGDVRDRLEMKCEKWLDDNPEATPLASYSSNMGISFEPSVRKLKEDLEAA